MKDYYEILNVSRNAEPEIISTVYRKLAQKYHPDKDAERKQLLEEKLKEINEAYEVLIDPAKRREYDKRLAELDKYSDIEHDANRGSSYKQTQYVKPKSVNPKIIMAIVLVATIGAILTLSVVNIQAPEIIQSSSLEPEESVPKVETPSDMQPTNIAEQHLLDNAHRILSSSYTFDNGLEGWSYWGDHGYTLSQDMESGNPAPAAKISGDSFDSTHGMEKVIVLDSWSGGPLILSFDYRVTSYYTDANTYLGIYDADTDQLLHQASIIPGGTRDTGWGYFSEDISGLVTNSSKIKIVLFLKDSQKINLNQANWYDNIELESSAAPTSVASFTLNTDKSIYSLGETVISSGKVHRTLVDIPVTIKVITPDEKIIKELNADVKPDATYATIFTLNYAEHDYVSGTWTIEAYYLDKVAKTSFQVRSNQVNELFNDNKFP